MVSLQAALLSVALCSAGETVLLDFHADWCAPCQTMNPTVDALKAKGYPVQKVNIDHHPAMAQRFRATRIPCFVMLVDGQEVDRVVGPTSLDRLEAMCRRGQTASREPQPGRGASASQAVAQWSKEPAGPAAGPLREPVQAQPAALTRGTPAGERGTVGSEQLIASSVRLRIEDPHGSSCGSGTIIDAREGEALILTCGHVFRDSKGRGPVTVDLFGPSGARGIPARVIDYDIESDVGLIAIETPGPVRVAPIAPPGRQLQPGQPVVSVGCDNGADPTARPSRITSLNKYLGPDNLQVAGQPVEGRSGGGLFSAEGHVVGVCNAADPEDREGLYAGLKSIHAMLDDAGLKFVYQSQPASEQLATGEGRPARAEGRPARGEGRPARGEVSPGRFHAPLVAVDRSRGTGSGDGAWLGAGAAEQLPPLEPAERAPLEEIGRRLDEGAEVICIIRSRNDPKAESEVLVLDQVSSNFLNHLAQRVRQQNGPTPTAQRQPR